jgi:GT2 family glycosyltransferase
LSDWFIAKYTPKYLKVIRYLNASEAVGVQIAVATPSRVLPARKAHLTVPRLGVRRAGLINRSIRTPGKPVGHKASGNATKIFQQAIEDDIYPISNGIGIGILSYNRLGSIQRLVNSIRKYTNLHRTTVFISDESTSADVKEWLSQQTDVVYLLNNQRLGIAGNSNRLLRCLSRFKYKLLLNDDVEILSKGWDSFYFDAMRRSKMHHFCFRQLGIYGATGHDEAQSDHKGLHIKTIQDKPQGSVMAFDELAFETVGYFDERFGIYGTEHVDWSKRVIKSGIQTAGHHDVMGSEKYFKIWNEESAVEDRTAHFIKSKEIYRKILAENKIYVQPTNASEVPSISVVIPCRMSPLRTSSIPTVINNIRAQRFPNIDILVIEQDKILRIADEMVYPCRHKLAGAPPATPFNKAHAFNVGVSKAKYDKILLHDADIVVPGWYASKISKILDNYDSCHIGKQVLYLTLSSTNEVNQQQSLAHNKQCENAIDYFEGGSLAINKSAYIKIGGFDERFVGYGVEDCEFYQRIKECTKFSESRTVTMVHLWHDRTPGWDVLHKNNKNYFADIQSRFNLKERCDILNGLFSKRYSFK